MFKKIITVLISFLIGNCFVNADNKFLNEDFKSSEVNCKVVGQNGPYKIFNEANEMNVLAFGNYFIQIGETQYKLSSCECNADDGTCRIGVIGTLSGIYYKTMINFHLFQEDKVKDKSFDTLYQQLSEKHDQLRQLSYDQTTNNLYIPNIYTNNNTVSEFYGITYANLKGLVEKDTQFPLVYVIKNHEEEEEWAAMIASYEINGVVQCENDSYSFSDTSAVRTTHVREGHHPTLPQNCTWGEDPSKYLMQSPQKEGDRCGRIYGVCPNSLCCSKTGVCEKASSQCDKGCQPKYGQCSSATQIAKNSIFIFIATILFLIFLHF